VDSLTWTLALSSVRARGEDDLREIDGHDGDARGLQQLLAEAPGLEGGRAREAI